MVPSGQGDTQNSRRSASPLLRLVEEEVRWEVPDHLSVFFLKIGGGTEKKRAVTCMVLKAKTSNKCKNLELRRDEFCGLDQFTCRNCGGGDRGRVAIYRPFGEVSLSLNRTVTCMVLMANDRRTSCPCHDEFRGPLSDYVRQVALATTTTT
ncbi:uncharacterized protein TNCV_5060841 [Trichonephila clavipes]|nr:uncharacterized protein TNCV_5060841 [Trichonephila clavipes]